MTTPDITQSVTPWNRFSFVLLHPPYSPDLVLNDCHFFWPVKDALRGRHFRYDGGKGRRCMSGWHSNQITSSPDNLCLSITLEDVCRGLCWISMWLKCINFCNKSLYIFFRFHLTDPLVSSLRFLFMKFVMWQYNAGDIFGLHFSFMIQRKLFLLYLF